MKTSMPTDEGEPRFNPTHVFTLCILLVLVAACHNDSQHSPATPKATVKKKTLKTVIPALAPVIVEAKKAVKPRKKIYLTFDDGPNKGTRNVLDIVQQENIPVTFFIVGEHVFASPGQNQVWDSLKTARNIEICNHSYTHAHNRYDNFYQLPETVVRDMERTKAALLPDNIIVRAPGRNSWRIDSLHFTDIRKSKTAIDSLQKAGFIVMGWDLEWHYDPKTLQVKNTADELLRQIDSLFKKGKTKYPDNLVLLAHDQVYHSAADSLQLREFIQKIKGRDDYELALVSNYPAIKTAIVPLTDSAKTLTPGANVAKKGDSL